ncbi:MAG: hypothetical protein ABJO52_20885 [Nisaea sp.]|uniref:hypothetical protein n=1 Tax=Nisaea sp. TaxID=2024842 RepID=UPI00329985B2
MDKKKPDIATRDELDHLIADRKNDPEVPEYNHPAPSWIDNSEDPKRIQMRMRERRINYLESRLNSAGREFEREFERNS